MSDLQHPSEAECILNNIARDGANALIAMDVLHKALEVIAQPPSGIVMEHNLALARGALHNMSHLITDSQYLTARLGRVLRSND